MKLYVGNISWNATNDDLKNLFNEFGNCRAHIVMDRESGRPRGFGFVTYEDQDCAIEAMEHLNDAKFMGRNIIVNEARERTDKNGNNGNGRKRQRTSR